MVSLKLVHTQLAAAGLGGDIEGEVKVAPAASTDARSKMDGQGADDKIAWLYLLGVEMGALFVNGQSLALCPFDGTVVTTNEKSA